MQGALEADRITVEMGSLHQCKREPLCPLLALSGHFNRALERSLLGEERTIASAR